MSLFSSHAPLASRSLDERRAQMVDTQLRRRDITDSRVLQAMRRVERHRFVDPSNADEAYEDRPVTIGDRQTISQPYIVAKMTQLCAIEPGARVLEIGTGSGYQAAVLAELGAEVFTVERIAALQERARRVLEELGYRRIHYRQGDGFEGWPEHAPYDAIMVTAAPLEVPPALYDQLADGGRLVVPVGGEQQQLRLVTREGEAVRERDVLAVRFVPLVPGA